MTIDELLARLEGVRRSGRGWMALSPTRAERTPSLKIDLGDDGRILLHDFGDATISISEICAAIGIAPRDLFPGSPSSASRFSAGQRASQPTYCVRTWLELASDLQDESNGYWLRAMRVLGAATGLDVSDWSDLQTDIALTLVSLAYDDLALADELEQQAFGLRSRGLQEEESRHAA